jgi:HEXXH motif-containing protein
MLIKFFDLYPTSVVLQESQRVLKFELSAILDKFIEVFDDRIESSCKPIIQYFRKNIDAFEDTPRLRHWLYVSKCMLRSKIQGNDLEPGSVQHLNIDSLAPNRVITLHIIESLSNIADSSTLLSDVTFDLSTLKLKKIPLGKLGYLKFQEPPTFLNCMVKGGDFVVLYDQATFSSSHPNANREFQRSYSTLSLEIPIYDAGLCDVTKCNAPIVRDPATVADWAETALQDSLLLLASIDETLLAECKKLSPAVLPLHSGGISYGSASAQDMLGLIFLPGIQEVLDLAECYLHESLHQKLFRMDTCRPLFSDPNAYVKDEFYSPWRNDARPLNGILHGCYVFTGVSLFWSHLAKSSDYSTANSAFQYFYRLEQVKRGIEVLSNHKETLSNLGTRVLNDISDFVANMPPDIGLDKNAKMEATRRLEAHSTARSYKR